MSKSKGNIVVPVGRPRPLTAPTRCAGTSSPPSSRGTATASRIERVGEGVRLFLQASCGTPTASYVLYANATDATPASRRPTSTAGSSRAWRATVEVVTERLEAFDATIAGRAIADVRRRPLQLVRAPLAAALLGRRPAPRSRRCAQCLVTVAQLLAPFTPFVADEIYDNLDGAEPSVHLTRLARAPARATSSSRRRWRPRARRCASASPRAAQAKVKVRQPLREAVVVAAGARARGDRARSPTSCATSSTSRRCASSSEADELGSYEVKPNYRTLGPRFGKAMPQVAAAVAALDPAHVAAALRDGRHGRRQRSTATTTSSAADDLLLAMQPLEGYQLEREGSHAVALDLALDDDAAPRGPGARGRPRGPERAQGARASRSRTASR